MKFLTKWRNLLKAKDWAKRFEAGGEVNDEIVIGEFALETRELIENRTRFSTTEEKGKVKASLNNAVDGALREQEQKWQAIQGKVARLQGVSFNKAIMVEHLNDVKTKQDTWKNQAKPDNKQEKESKDGRNLVTC